MIDKGYIGHQIRSEAVAVERGRLKFFAQAIGETDPIYTDVEAAQAAGHPDVLAPPTFIFSIELETVDWIKQMAQMNVDLARVLHGEQYFEYHAPIHAGDAIRFEGEFTDIYDRKGGLLEFAIYKSEAFNQDDVHVASVSRTIVVRHPEGSA